MLCVLSMKHPWPEIRSHLFTVCLHPTVLLTPHLFVWNFWGRLRLWLQRKWGKMLVSIFKIESLHKHVNTTLCHTCAGKKMSAVFPVLAKYTPEMVTSVIFYSLSPQCMQALRQVTQSRWSPIQGRTAGQRHAHWWKYSFSVNTFTCSRDMLWTVTTCLHRQEVQWHTYHNYCI